MTKNCSLEPLFVEIGDRGIWIGDDVVPFTYPGDPLEDMVCSAKGFGSGYVVFYALDSESHIMLEVSNVGSMFVRDGGRPVIHGGS